MLLRRLSSIFFWKCVGTAWPLKLATPGINLANNAAIFFSVARCARACLIHEFAPIINSKVMANRIQGNKRSSMLSKGRTSFSLSFSLSPTFCPPRRSRFVYLFARESSCVKLNWPRGRQEHSEPRRERNETANIVKDFVSASELRQTFSF